MDASFNQDQVNSNINSYFINDDNRINKKWTMRNFLFCPFAIDLWDIQDLTLQIDDDIEDDKLHYSSQTLSKLSQLNKLTILISKKSPEQVVNTLLGGISNLINLSDLLIEFQLKYVSSSQKDKNYGESHFFEGISKLIGLKKLSLLLSYQNDETVNKLLDSVILLPNLIYLQLDLGALYLKNGITYIKLNYLFKLKQLQQSNSVLRVQLQSGNVFTMDLSQLELLTHLSLNCSQYAMSFVDLRTLGYVLSTLINLEYLELEIRITEFSIEEYGMPNPLIPGGSFVNHLKLKNLKIMFMDQLNFNVQIYKWIYETISQFKNLSQLTLNIKHPFRLEKEGSTILGQNLSSLLKLTELYINEIPFNQNLLEGISKLAQLSNLSLNFSLSKGSLDNDYSFLSACIAKLSNLEKLNLSLQHQKITNSQLTMITSAMDNLSKLSSLKLQLRCLEFEKSMVFFASKKGQSNLRELHLSLVDCKVSKQQANNLPIGISMLTNIISLIITGYFLDDDLFNNILSEACKLPRLKILSTDKRILRPQRFQLLKNNKYLVTIRKQKD